MEIVLAIVVGALFTASIYLLLRRTLVKLLIGLAILGNATNLLIFSAAGMRRGLPPVIPADAAQVPALAADPLPQALILTAIVIGFGVLAFGLALAYQVYKTVGTENPDHMREFDSLT